MQRKEVFVKVPSKSVGANVVFDEVFRRLSSGEGDVKDLDENPLYLIGWLFAFVPMMSSRSLF